ncbi:hypothetical protein BJX99DRAFT_260428 [Aspergillus californicus]
MDTLVAGKTITHLPSSGFKDPGSGKSYLISKVIDTMRGRNACPLNNEGIAFFYCKRGDKPRRDQRWLFAKVFDSLRRHGKSHGWQASRPSSLSETVPEQPEPGQPEPGVPGATDMRFTAKPIINVPTPTIDASLQEIISPDNSAPAPQGADYAPDLSTADQVPGHPAMHSIARSQHYDNAYISPIQAGLWDPPPADSWLLASDFDVGALDSALDATIAEWALPNNNNPLLEPQGVLGSQSAPLDLDGFDSTGDGNPRSLLATMGAVRCYSGLRADGDSASWEANDADRQAQTHIFRDGLTRFISRAPSERPSETLYVDEQYRDSLSSKLRPRQYDNTHLSVDHLNQCLRLYLKRFHPIFPIVHIPTFRPNSRNALLFLSMCSIGSLFIGSREGIAQGHGVFSRLHKAILASWETHFSGSKTEALSMVQAALLGQTFGTLSRRSNDIVMTDAFQGTMIAWARKVNAFDPVEPERVPEGLTKHAIERAWSDWIHRELARRIALALHIHDMKMSNLHHHDPLLRHFTIRYTHIAPDALFEAPAAEKWYALMPKTPSSNQPDHAIRPMSLKQWIISSASLPSNPISQGIHASGFAAYSILANLNACIIEARGAGDLDAFRTDLTLALTKWHELYWVDKDPANVVSDVFDLSALWHWCFISLYSDPADFEQALGQDGAVATIRARDKLQSCAINTAQYGRCLFHASMLLDTVGSTSLDATPAIHVPDALYCASLVWLCQGLFLRGYTGGDLDWKQEVLNQPEIKNLEVQLVKRAWPSFRERLVQHPSDMVSNFVDLLRKLNRWGVAESFADVVADLSHTNLHTNHTDLSHTNLHTNHTDLPHVS